MLSLLPSSTPRSPNWEAITFPGLLMAVLAVVVAGVQEWEEEPGYREVNPGGEVIMVCRVRNKGGECSCEQDKHILIVHALSFWAFLSVPSPYLLFILFLYPFLKFCEYIYTLKKSKFILPFL